MPAPDYLNYYKGGSKGSLYPLSLLAPVSPIPFDHPSGIPFDPRGAGIPFAGSTPAPGPHQRHKSPARLQPRFRDAQQISRGNFDRLPHATAGFTTSALDGYGLRCHWPTRPAPYASDPVLVHRLVRLLHASFRPSGTGTPLRFAMTSPPSGCPRGLSPPSCRTCSAYQKKGPGFRRGHI